MMDLRITGVMQKYTLYGTVHCRINEHILTSGKKQENNGETHSDM